MKQGIRNVKMDDIAMEAGISKRTLYEMFGDKENLLLECLRHTQNSEMELRRITNRPKTPSSLLYAMEHAARSSKTFPRLLTGILKYSPCAVSRGRQGREPRRASDFFMDGIEKGYFRSDVKLEILFTFARS
jgi:AcrR family transcriptional regulator